MRRRYTYVVSKGILSLDTGDFSVRDFRPSDQCHVREIVLLGLAERFGAIDYSLNPDLDDIDINYIRKGHRFFVAEVEEMIVGCSGLLKESDGAHRIVRMSVLADFRRRGLAQDLANHCVEHALADGATEVLAFTQPEWTDAVAFYHSQGFRQFAADEIDIHLRRALSSGA